MSEEKTLRLKVASSPHVASPIDTRNLMRDVIIALVPALCVAIFFFGFRALISTVVSAAACSRSSFDISAAIRKASPMPFC